METVTFANSEVRRLRSGRIHTTIVRQLFDAYHASYIKDRFILPVPCAFPLHEMQSVFEEHEYWVSEKTDGTRYILISGYYDPPDNTHPYVAFVNRRYDIYLVDIPMYVDAYLGTIVDGELVECNGGFVYYVFDAIQFCGRDITQSSFSSRLKYGNRFIEEIVSKREERPPSHCSIMICIKHFEPLSNFSELVTRTQDRLGIDIDGYVFIPEDVPVATGRQRCQMKWKPLSMQTADFDIHFDGKSNMLCVWNPKARALQSIGYLRPDNGVYGSVYTDKIVECSCYNYQQSIWRPVTIRTDKTRPNDIETFNAMCSILEEGGSLDMLMDLCKKCDAFWNGTEM
jgi:hypothetical protein